MFILFCYLQRCIFSHFRKNKNVVNYINHILLISLFLCTCTMSEIVIIMHLLIQNLHYIFCRLEMYLLYALNVLLNISFFVMSMQYFLRESTFDFVKVA